MAETDKIANFFLKHDRSKKKTGFVTINEVTEKKKQKLDSQIRRQLEKNNSVAENGEDDEWTLIGNNSYSSTTVVPFQISEETPFEKENDTETKKLIRVESKEKSLPLQDAAPSWNRNQAEHPDLPQAEAAAVAEPPKPAVYRPGALRQKAVKQITLEQEDFPDLLSSISGKKENRKNAKKVNGVSHH